MKRYRIVCREMHRVEYEALADDILTVLTEPNRWEISETISDEIVEIEEISLLNVGEIPL